MAITPRVGISKTGNKAEVLFRSLTSSLKPKEAALGDAVKNGIYAEVKKVSGDTLNQVRAVKYITLIAYDADLDNWYVVPACDVVALIAVKERGQHTENPFESATLSLRNLGPFKVSSANLSAAWAAAVAKSDGKPLLKQKMKDVLADCKKLSSEHKSAVRALI
jgi:hypothetical protein